MLDTRERPVLRAERVGARHGVDPGGLRIKWGNEPAVLTQRGRYLQQHRTNQRVNGPGAGVAHALEAPEHEPALRENGEEVEHGGSGKGARPAPGTEAAIARLPAAPSAGHVTLAAPETGSAVLPLRAAGSLPSSA